MLCPACQRVLPADVSGYTVERASLIVKHGLCVCDGSAPPAEVPAAEAEATAVEAEVPAAEAQVPAAEAQVPAAEAQVPAAEAQVPAAEAAPPPMTPFGAFVRHRAPSPHDEPTEPDETDQEEPEHRDDTAARR